MDHWILGWSLGTWISAWLSPTLLRLCRRLLLTSWKAFCSPAGFLSTQLNPAVGSWWSQSSPQPVNERVGGIKHPHSLPRVRQIWGYILVSQNPPVGLSCPQWWPLEYTQAPRASLHIPGSASSDQPTAAQKYRKKIQKVAKAKLEFIVHWKVCTYCLFNILC